MPWKFEQITDRHEISGFDCGNPELNRWLQRHSLANASNGISRTFLGVDHSTSEVQGFFCLSMGSVQFTDFPRELQRNFPRYPIPTAHLGRMAVCTQMQRQGWGGVMLVEAMRRVLAANQNVGAYAIDVVAKDDAAKAFYLKYQFMPLREQTHHLFLPMRIAEKLVLVSGRAGLR